MYPFSLQKVLDQHANFSNAAKAGAELLLAECLYNQLEVFIRDWHILYLFYQFCRMFEVEIHELLDLRLIHGLAIDVDKDRARQRLVCSAHYRFERRRDRRFPFLFHYRNGLQLFGVFGIVGITEVTEGIDVAAYALDQDVIVLACSKIAPAGFGLANNGLGKVVKGAGIGACAEKVQRRIRPCRVYLVPLSYLTLSGWFPNLLEFSNGHALDPVVLWIYHYRKSVVCNGKFNILNACLLAYLHLLCEYRARGILNIGFAAAEFLEATTCSGDAYRYPYGPPLFLLKLLGNRLGYRIHGA